MARLGGDEFAIILAEGEPTAAWATAERIRTRVRGHGGGLTASFGIAAFPSHGRCRASLLEAADRALYTAKELGRDRSVIRNPEVEDMLPRAAGL